MNADEDHDDEATCFQFTAFFDEMEITVRIVIVTSSIPISNTFDKHFELLGYSIAFFKLVEFVLLHETDDV